MPIIPVCPYFSGGQVSLYIPNHMTAWQPGSVNLQNVPKKSKTKAEIAGAEQNKLDST